MKTVGIIAEYNPFHNGHKYHIEKSKELTDADYCIVIMSGNFVQRGAPAIMDKYMRARLALASGADLVIELPVHYSCASAEYFANAGIAMLDKLGVCDCVCFGSECGDIEILSAISDILISENAEFKKTLKERIKEGEPYPKARNAALLAAAPHLAGAPDVLNQPNNILALEYLKALKKRQSTVTPYTLPRWSSAYHDIKLNHSFSSARAIRESIKENRSLSCIKDEVPGFSYELMEKNYLKGFPVFPEDFAALLHYKLLQEQDAGFDKYFDIDGNFSDRLIRHLPDLTGYGALCETLKSKNMTYTRVARSLIHILLNIYQSDMLAYCADDYVYYARMLGFKRDASPLLGAIKSASSLPLISKLADAPRSLASANGVRMLQQDIEASHIYSLAVQHKFNRAFCNEYTKPVIIL